MLQQLFCSMLQSSLCIYLNEMFLWPFLAIQQTQHITYHLHCLFFNKLCDRAPFKLSSLGRPPLLRREKKCCQTRFDKVGSRSKKPKISWLLLAVLSSVMYGNIFFFIHGLHIGFSWPIEIIQLQEISFRLWNFMNCMQYLYISSFKPIPEKTVLYFSISLLL